MLPGHQAVAVGPAKHQQPSPAGDQRHHTRLVKRFATENARPLKKLRGLFGKVASSIERIEAAPVEPEM